MKNETWEQWEKRMYKKIDKGIASGIYNSDHWWAFHNHCNLIRYPEERVKYNPFTGWFR